MKTARSFLMVWLPLLLVVAGCQPTPSAPGMKLGKPYTVDGRTYYPEYDPTYDKIGMASWYGPGFHGKYTASGEIFNQNDLTAAHPTLPMPSLVRVTNLSNGKSVIVRINDRGPFKSNRIIDLSKQAAMQINMLSTSKVRVQFLKKETDDYIASLDNASSQPTMQALNQQAKQQRDDSIIHSTEPGDQIVESTVSNTHAGQTVGNAAPVVTVSSDDLASPAMPARDHANTAKPVTLSRDNSQDGNDDETADAKPMAAQPVRLVAQAYAEPPQQEQSSPNNQWTGKTRAPSAPAVSTHAVSSPGGFYIQAGSFASEENAHKLSSKLESIATVDIGKVDMGAKTWWRVRLGPYVSKEEAASALDKVHLAGLPDARIVQQ